MPRTMLRMPSGYCRGAGLTKWGERRNVSVSGKGKDGEVVHSIIASTGVDVSKLLGEDDESDSRFMISARSERETKPPWKSCAPEILVEGPAGTGKTRALLTKVHLSYWRIFSYARALMCRSTLTHLTDSAVQTFVRDIVAGAEYLEAFGGNRFDPPGFRYPNGSRLFLGGLDKIERIMSTEYDLIYVNEVTDLGIDEWERLTSRLRSAAIPFQQIMADCNPVYPSHWANRRSQTGEITRFQTFHKDNPFLYDDVSERWTDVGEAYMARLEALTGVRRERLLLGKWVAAEGAVYSEWQPEIHVVEPFDIPESWARLLAVDFGYVNPFVCQWWAVDGDGRMILYREVYKTRVLVEDVCRANPRLAR